MSTPKEPQDKNHFFTTHGATNEEQCVKMAKKYGWDYSHYEQTRNPILTHECFFEGEAEFPTTHGDNENE